MADRNNRKKNEYSVGKTLFYFYLLFLICAGVIIAKVLYITYIFEPEDRIMAELTPKSSRQTLHPTRGEILARDGRTFATSASVYRLAMDCTVQKKEFSSKPEEEKKWREEAKQLAYELPRFFPEKTGAQYYEMMLRDRKNGKAYRPIGRPVDYGTLQEIKQLPLFNRGGYKGGLIAQREEVRQYPYGKLARRTIGFIRSNTEASKNNKIGLEGHFDYALHGTDGYEWMKRSDGGALVQNLDSTYVAPVDGNNIRTTLDVDIQDIADRALRTQIDTNRRIEGGCLVVMDVKTGAIRAMVNLRRDPTTGVTEEHTNYAVGRAGEPGSVFKTATLMSLMEDGYVKSIDERIPTNHGVVKGLSKHDAHITDYERKNNRTDISILEGLQMSSNYVFAYLATLHYGRQPKKFIDNLYMFKLGQAFDFDLDGMATPVIPSTDSKFWSGSSLATTAYGYSISETPLHILTFYNAIANKGKMMKPYLVESVEKDGKILEKRGPSILNASICSRATADTLTRGLANVVQFGTGSRLKKAACKVAGKTGTARILLDSQDSKTSAGKYSDEYGRMKNQATFVGFFPAENPQYSAICTVYSILSPESFYGGTIPALAIRDVVDGICAMDPYWVKELEPSGIIPEMKAPEIEVADKSLTSVTVPNLKGYGLKDAVRTLESLGLKCVYSGVGHVSSQSPSVGKKLEKGKTVTITLK